MTATKRGPDFKLTIDTPYFPLPGDLWGVGYDNFNENWPRYNDTALYMVHISL